MVTTPKSRLPERVKIEYRYYKKDFIVSYYFDGGLLENADNKGIGELWAAYMGRCKGKRPFEHSGLLPCSAKKIISKARRIIDYSHEGYVPSFDNVWSDPKEMHLLCEFKVRLLGSENKYETHWYFLNLSAHKDKKIVYHKVVPPGSNGNLDLVCVDLGLEITCDDTEVKTVGGLKRSYGTQEIGFRSHGRTEKKPSKHVPKIHEGNPLTQEFRRV